MFGLGLPEILFIVLLAALILGPEHMPRVARMLGKWSAKARSAATTLGQAVIQDEDTRAAVRDLSKLQNDIRSAKDQVLSINHQVKDGVAGVAKMAFDGVDIAGSAVQKDDKSGMQTGAADNRFGRDDLQTTPSGCEENSFFTKSIAHIHQRRDWQPSYGDLLPENRERCVRLAKPAFLPESESRKVYRKRVELPAVNISNIEFNSNPFVRYAKTSLALPRALTASESEKVRCEKVTLLRPEVRGSGECMLAVGLPEPKLDRAMYRVHFMWR